MVDSDLSALIITGAPTTEDMAEAWATLYAEFHDINKSNEQDYVLDLRKNIEILDSELITIASCLLFLLNVMYDKRVQDFLEGLDVYMDLNPDNREDYERQIASANNELAPRRLELQMKEQEYKEHLENQESNTIDRTYFTKQLRTIARFNKLVTIRAIDITVEEFVLMIQEIREANKSCQEEER